MYKNSSEDFRKISSNNINVIEYGIIPDGKTLNTERLQNLMDKCAAKDGGRIVFPPGRYLTGSLFLRSNTTLKLENGAVLIGSPNLKDYTVYNEETSNSPQKSKNMRALICAIDGANIHITGNGVIDGQGEMLQNVTGAESGRPVNLWFYKCSDISLSGISIRNSASWMLHYEKCRGIRTSGLDIWNHGARNNDGIDINGCKDVQISGCRIDTGDDAICIKSSGEAPSQNVMVRDCITRTYCNHFKLGTESAGGFKNIHAEGLLMVSSEHLQPPPRTGGADYRGACGIALGCVDGGNMENITVERVNMDQVRVPFFIRLGDRGKPVKESGIRQKVGRARNIKIKDIQASGASSMGCYIAGLSDSPIENVHIENCNLEFEGGGTKELITRAIPENREAYPAMETFGELPAWGIFSRDVTGLKMSGLIFRSIRSDARNALMWHRCRKIYLHDIQED